MGCPHSCVVPKHCLEKWYMTRPKGCWGQFWLSTSVSDQNWVAEMAPWHKVITGSSINKYADIAIDSSGPFLPFPREIWANTLENWPWPFNGFQMRGNPIPQADESNSLNRGSYKVAKVSPMSSSSSRKSRHHFQLFKRYCEDLFLKLWLRRSSLSCLTSHPDYEVLMDKTGNTGTFDT